MTLRTIFITIAIIILFALLGGGYWYFTTRAPAQVGVTATSTPSGSTFIPIDRPFTPGDSQSTGNTVSSSTMSSTTSIAVRKPIPTLRLISATPIGGYAASTTGTTTVVRWLDRGRGNVYETKTNTLDVTTLSNTIVPRIYSSSWNKDMSAFIGFILQEGSETPTAIYASLKAPAISPTVVDTSTSTAPAVISAVAPAPFELKGKNLPNNTLAYAVSPTKNKIFILVGENGGSSGYTANFDGTKVTKIFSTPLTQINVDWPSENIIAITTKGASDQDGFLYFVDPQTGTWTKVLGPLKGLSTKVSRDGKKVIASVAGASKDVVTNIYTVASSTGTDAVIRTIADKCVWGNFYKEMVYCAVPFQDVSGYYPDDWYKGTLTTIDKIWQVNTNTGEVHLLANLIGESKKAIDAFNLGLDDKDNYLFFMNKTDLSFWSLDLVSAN